MHLTGYYDLATKRFTPDLEENGSLQLPVITAGEDITIATKYRQTRDGAVSEVRPVVKSMRAVLGQVDARPISGTVVIEVDGLETPEITYDPLLETATTPILFEDTLKDALEDIDGITEVTIERRFDSFIVMFNDDPTIQRELVITKNTLFPSSFFRIREYLRGGNYYYEIRPIKAPVAATSTFSAEYGLIPTIVSLRDGGEVGDTKWSEIQRLQIPPSFTGSVRLKRGQLRTDPISRNSSLEEITETLQTIADEGGSFRTIVLVDDFIHIYFEGSMIGINQDLIEVELFDSPAVASVVSMTTRTRAMAELMMQVDLSPLVLEVHALLEDLEDSEVDRWHCVLRQQVNIREAVDWEELATAPDIDWLNPPQLTRTIAFSPGQVSNGQIHYSTPFGDGLATSFQISHGLDTGIVDVIILENAEPGAKMIEGTDYTWVRNSDNMVTITWLTGVPEEDEYVVTVLGLAMTSFFDGHGHVTSEIEGLDEWMTSVEERLALLGAGGGGRVFTEASTDAGESARWELPKVWELFPSRAQPSRPDTGRIYDVDLDEKDDNGVMIIKRGRGLLPAIHDASVDELEEGDSLPALSQDHANKVFLNSTGAEIQLDGGSGLRSTVVKNGGYIGCTGDAFFPVVPYERYAGYAFTTDYATSPTLLTFASELAELLEVGKAIQVSSTTTLPAGLTAATDYFIKSVDFETRQVSLSLTDGGDAVELSSNGTGTHTLHVEDSISYYPQHFERTLATIHVNEFQLRSGKDLYLSFGFEAVLLKALTDAQCSVIIQIGEARGLTGSGEGKNLNEIVWRSLPALDQSIVLSTISTTHHFGLRVSRRRVDGVDTLRAWRMLYGAEESGVVPPRTANFSVRVLFGKFDTADNLTDWKGLLMLSGMRIESNVMTGADYESGFAVIK